MTKVQDVLLKSQLFGGLPDDHLEEIKKISVDKYFNKGEIIFFDGDEGSGFRRKRADFSHC